MDTQVAEAETKLHPCFGRPKLAANLHLPPIVPVQCVFTSVFTWTLLNQNFALFPLLSRYKNSKSMFFFTVPRFC